MYTRTPQGAIAWATSLLFVPVLAVPLYWLFGRRRFEGYVRAHRSSRSGTRQLANDVREALEAARSTNARTDSLRRVFEKLVGHPFSGGNRLDLLIDGEETFDALFEEIRRAEKYVLVEFFLVRDDDLGMRLHSALIERVRAGVRCCLIYDRVGSRKLSSGYVQSLRDAGVEVSSFVTAKRIPKLAQINFRNHRKIVIVDGHVGFIGGHNIGDEYLGKDPEYSPWRDTHLRLEGPIVNGLQLVFVEDWHWAAGEENLELDWTTPDSKKAEAGMDALLVPSGPADEMETGALLSTQVINLAASRLWIATPYFVPDRSAVTALELAVLRGVDVRVLVPRNSDSNFADWAGHSLIQELLPVGVRFFMYEHGFMHQKVILIDSVLASVGTANFDNRSFRLNFEISALCTSPIFISEVERMLQRDLAGCVEVTSLEEVTGSFALELRARLARLTALVQ